MPFVVRTGRNEISVHRPVEGRAEGDAVAGIVIAGLANEMMCAASTIAVSLSGRMTRQPQAPHDRCDPLSAASPPLIIRGRR
jgi:hypothetical protein